MSETNTKEILIKPPVTNKIQNLPGLRASRFQDNDKEEDNLCCGTILWCSRMMLVLALVAGIICYLVFGIIFLVNDYDTAKDCDGSDLWAYVLVAIILAINKKNAAEIDNSDALGMLMVSVTIELGLAIWGAIELFDKADDCPELKSSSLWDFGLATFLLQILYVSVIVLFISGITVYNYCANRKSVNISNA